MPTYYRNGDAIEGEKIAFDCRKYVIHKRPIHRTSSHRAKAGTLDNAFCVINKQFRTIPERND
jgi:hypothetical protein